MKSTELNNLKIITNFEKEFEIKNKELNKC